MNDSAPLALARSKHAIMSVILTKRATNNCTFETNKPLAVARLVQIPVLVAHFLPINNTPRLFVSHKHIALQLPQTQTDQIFNFFIYLK
jgi:hypothetical protein